jgi:transcriptional regulator with XRE-family HTH domain
MTAEKCNTEVRPGRGRRQRTPEAAQLGHARKEMFQTYLASLREAAGLSYREAAQMAGISSPQLLRAYEVETLPDGGALERLAGVYGVDARGLVLLCLWVRDPDAYRLITGDDKEAAL